VGSPGGGRASKRSRNLLRQAWARSGGLGTDGDVAKVDPGLDLAIRPRNPRLESERVKHFWESEVAQNGSD
jgi:hypothetical protein